MQKIIITVSSYAVLLLLFAALALFPLLRGISMDSRNLEETYVQVLKASLAEQETADFLRFSQQEAENFERLDALFVDEETPIEFIEFLEDIAALSNIELKITPANPRVEKGVAWPVMDFQLASSASYPQLLSFLTKLENAPYLLEVRNTNITRARGKEGALEDVSFTLQVKVFTTPLRKSS